MDNLNPEDKNYAFKVLFEVPVVGNDSEFKLCNPESLLDVTARKVGKELEPCDIVNCQPPLDEALYKKVLLHAFPKSMSAAMFMVALSNEDDIDREANALIYQKKIKSIKQVGFLLVTEFSTTANTESVQPETTKVCVEFAKQRITSVSCTHCTPGCVHAYAAVMYRIDLPDKVRIYPPLTETLCSMSRNKLQKLIHKVVSKDPAHLVELLYSSMDELNQEDDSIEEIHDPTITDTCGTEDMLQSALESHFKHQSKKQAYNFTYDWNDQSLLEKEMKKAVTLHIGHPNTTLALQYLHLAGTLAEAYLLAKDVYRSFFVNSPQTQCAVKLFLHDLMVNAGSIFPQGTHIGIIDVEKWKQFLHECHKEFETNKTSRHIIHSSKWVELPRLYPLYKDEIEQIFGLTEDEISKGYLGEAIASLFIPQPPAEYEALIKGEKDPSESDYNEPLPVMMARASSYHFVNTGEKDGKIKHLKENLRIIDRIIIKLAKMGLKYSVLSVFGQHVNIEDPRLLEMKPFLKFIVENSKGINLSRKSPQDNKTFKQDHERSSSGSSSMKENSDPKSNSTTPVESSHRKRKSSLVLGSANSPKRRRSARLEESTIANNLNTRDERNAVIKESGDHSYHKIDVSQSVQREVYPKCIIDENDIFVSPDGKAPGQGLNKAQLAYSLLFWLRHRTQLCKKYGYIDKPIITLHENEDVIKGAHFLALELSRYRLTTKQKDLYKKEQSRLSAMEKDISETSFSWVCSYNSLRWYYIAAWHHIGFEFYGEHLPAKLGNLVFRGAFIEENRNSDRMSTKQFNTENPEDVYMLQLCDFMMLEAKDLYTFHTRQSGPYRALENNKVLRLPTSNVYNAFVCYYKSQTEENDVLQKMTQVAEESIQSSVKMFCYGLWNSFIDNTSNGNELRKQTLIMRLTLHLCDLFSGKYAIKFSESIRKACRVIGIPSLAILKEGIGNGDWKRYVTMDDLEGILQGVKWDVRQEKDGSDILVMFYSRVLDLLQHKLDDPNANDDEYQVRWNGRVSALLGVNTSSTCTDVLAFASKMLSIKRKGPVRDLAIRALVLVLDHMREASNDSLCREKISSVIRDGVFRDGQIEHLINSLLSIEHCPTEVCYVLLEKLTKRSKGMDTDIFNRKLSLYLVRNTMDEIWEELMNESDSDKDFFPLIKNKYDLFVKHVQLDEKEKREKFKEMIKDLKGRFMFNIPVIAQIEKMLR